MSKIRTFFRPIPGTEEINGNNRSVKVEKVLQGKKWWMLKWHDCYTKIDEPDGDEYYPIKSGKFFSDDEWKAMCDGEKYVWVFFHCFPVKL